MTDVDLDLSRSEAQLAREEAHLQAELERLKATRVELGARVVALKLRVSEARAAGAGDPELARRLESLVLPVPQTGARHAEARARRQAALEARRQAFAELRQLLDGWTEDDARLTRQVSSDEALVEARARAAAEARAAVVPLLPARKAASTNASASPGPSGRAAQRVPMHAVIDLTSDDNFFSGFSANLSDGGVFVATVNLLPLGTEVDLSFSLPTGEAVQAHGVVRWVREVNDALLEQYPGMGVQFSSLAPEAEAAVHRFVQEREPLFFAAA